MPFVQISQSEWLIFVGVIGVKNKQKLSAFRQNVVSLVENRRIRTENASDKKRGESTRCFLDQEGKFPPSTQSDSSRLNKKVPDRYAPRGRWTDVLLVVQYCDFDHLRKYVVDKHLDSALHKHLANFNQ